MHLDRRCLNTGIIVGHIKLAPACHRLLHSFCDLCLIPHIALQCQRITATCFQLFSKCRHFVHIHIQQGN